MALRTVTIGLLIPVLFYGLHWSGRWEHLQQLEHDAEGLKAEVAVAQQNVRDQAKVHTRFLALKAKVNSRSDDADGSGALLQIPHASVRVQLGRESKPEGRGVKLDIEGPAAAVASWLQAVDQHPRQFTLTEVNLGAAGSGEVRGEVRVMADPLR